ncbi:MAG: rod shape-determining protein MreC [Candidatus Aminicenantes bacterium]|nr:rod shape-determining protein MreC [Candidatus Aminicenantes bacterium]
MRLAWKERKSALLIVGLCLGHLLLVSIQVPRGDSPTLFNRAVFAVFAPLQRAAQGVVRAVGSAGRSYREYRSLRAESQKMKKEFFFLRQENRFLRDALGAFREEAVIRRNLEAFRDNLAVARVIGVDTGNPYKAVIINRGSLDGVRKDMPVCDRSGHLIGRTVEPVALKESRVQLITDDESGVSVISEKDRLVGVLVGDAVRGRCLLKYIMITALGGTEGDVLLTTGFDKLYPAGIPVGRIVSVTSSPGLFKTVVVQPFFTFNELGEVAVLKMTALEW